MQKLSDYVRHGYVFWTSGTIEASKAAALVRKFCRYYAIDLDRNRRARAKKRGEGCAVFLAWPSSPGVLTWFLLVTQGDHPAHSLEKLRNALEPAGRLTLTGYELVRATRPGADKPALTWRMTSETYESWRTRIIDTVRRGDALTVRQSIASLYRVPGFAGSRAQVKKCLTLFKAEWKRTKSKEPFPTTPRFLAYVRRLECESIPLTSWLSACSKKPS